MRFLLLLSTWLIFAAIVAAQQPVRIVKTTTVYEYPQQQPTRYTLQAAPVPVPVTVYYMATPARVYRDEPRTPATPIRSGLRGLFGGLFGGR